MRRVHIGIVFQFFNLLEGMTVLENVTLPAVIVGAGAAGRDRTSATKFSTCWAWPTRPGRFGVLSGGQRQRLAIARRRQRADRGAGRRADGCARLRGRPGGAGAVPAVARRRPGDPARDPRPGRRGGRRPHRPHARRPGREPFAPGPAVAAPSGDDAALAEPWRGRHAGRGRAPAGADPAGRRDRHHRGDSTGRRPFPRPARSPGAGGRGPRGRAADRRGLGRPVAGRRTAQAVRISVAVVWAVVGTLLAIRRPQEPLGLVVLAFALAGSVAAATAGARAPRPASPAWGPGRDQPARRRHAPGRRPARRARRPPLASGPRRRRLRGRPGGGGRRLLPATVDPLLAGGGGAGGGGGRGPADHPPALPAGAGRGPPADAVVRPGGDAGGRSGAGGAGAAGVPRLAVSSPRSPPRPRCSCPCRSSRA